MNQHGENVNGRCVSMLESVGPGLFHFRKEGVKVLQSKILNFLIPLRAESSSKPSSWDTVLHSEMQQKV